MKIRLMLAFVLAAVMLCGCATDDLRPSGSLADGTFHQEIGNPLPSQLLTPNCPVQ